MTSAPQGYHSITPVLVVQEAASLIDFLVQTLEATVRLCIPAPNGKVAHSELTIGNSVVMVDDATPAAPAHRSTLYLYVDDVDAAHARAVAAGATSEAGPQDQFYGDRTANIRDPAGNLWTIATRIEDVSEEEMLSRIASLSP